MDHFTPSGENDSYKKTRLGAHQHPHTTVFQFHNGRLNGAVVAPVVTVMARRGELGGGLFPSPAAIVGIKCRNYIGSCRRSRWTPANPIGKRQQNASGAHLQRSLNGTDVAFKNPSWLAPMGASLRRPQVPDVDETVYSNLATASLLPRYKHEHLNLLIAIQQRNNAAANRKLAQDLRRRPSLPVILGLGTKQMRSAFSVTNGVRFPCAVKQDNRIGFDIPRPDQFWCSSIACSQAQTWNQTPERATNDKSDDASANEPRLVKTTSVSFD